MTAADSTSLIAEQRPVIIGGGNAGLAAAARFSANGVPCLLVEKQARLGGQLWLSGGVFSAAGTRRQASRGIRDSAAEHAADVRRIGHDRGTAHLIELATRHAGQAVDWLDGLGFPFVEECPVIVRSHEPYSKPRTYWGQHRANGGRAILETLLPHLDPGLVEIRTQTSLTEIGVGDSEDGALRVEWIELTDSDGPTRLAVDEVILATGGYAANRKLLRALQPASENALIGCLDHATGDSHELLRALDVPMVGGPDTYLPTMGMIENPERPGFTLQLDDARVIVDATARDPWEVWVNDRGDRFVNEATPSPDLRERRLLEQPNLSFWSVWNQTALEAMPTCPIGPDWTADRLLAEEPTWLVRANTVDELAARTGLPEERLADTLYRATREPDPHGRARFPVHLDQGPFFAVRSTGAMLLTRCGPQVDADLHPLTADGRAIRGLRTIGEILGMSQFSGDAFAGGMSVGPALSLGVYVADLLSKTHRAGV